MFSLAHLPPYLREISDFSLNHSLTSDFDPFHSLQFFSAIYFLNWKHFIFFSSPFSCYFAGMKDNIAHTESTLQYWTDCLMVPTVARTTQCERFVVCYFELCKTEILAWTGTLPPCAAGTSMFGAGRTDTKHQPTCALPQPARCSKGTRCWRWASTTQQRGRWLQEAVGTLMPWNIQDPYLLWGRNLRPQCANTCMQCLFLDLRSTSHPEVNRAIYVQKALHIFQSSTARGHGKDNITACPG